MAQNRGARFMLEWAATYEEALEAGQAQEHDVYCSIPSWRNAMGGILGEAQAPAVYRLQSLS